MLSDQYNYTNNMNSSLQSSTDFRDHVNVCDTCVPRNSLFLFSTSHPKTTAFNTEHNNLTHERRVFSSPSTTNECSCQPKLWCTIPLSVHQQTLVWITFDKKTPLGINVGQGIHVRYRVRVKEDTTAILLQILQMIQLNPVKVM